MYFTAFADAAPGDSDGAGRRPGCGARLAAAAGWGRHGAELRVTGREGESLLLDLTTANLVVSLWLAVTVANGLSGRAVAAKT